MACLPMVNWLTGRKVIYTDQHGHRVAHNPSTLDKSLTTE